MKLLLTYKLAHAAGEAATLKGIRRNILNFYCFLVVSPRKEVILYIEEQKQQFLEKGKKMIITQERWGFSHSSGKDLGEMLRANAHLMEVQQRDGSDTTAIAEAEAALVAAGGIKMDVIQWEEEGDYIPPTAEEMESRIKLFEEVNKMMLKLSD